MRKGEQKKPNQKMQAWIDARKRHHLSHAHVQMARELGMNPKKFGKIDNHRQEPWKMQLRQFIEHLYLKRFGKDRPDNVMSIEDRIRREEQKKALKREAKQRRQTETKQQDGADTPSPEVCGSTPREPF
jgi:hypothetical protein